MTEPDLTAFTALTELDELRRVVSDLQARLRKARSKSEELREAVSQGIQDALVILGPLPAVKAPAKDTRSKKTEHALWHLTDWQGSKVTTTYNSEVMRERVLRFCDKAQVLTEIQRADHPVDDATILLGGDMGEGLFNYPTQPFEVDASLFGQYTFSARLVAEAIRRALATYQNVTVVCEWGNHGRLGAQRAAVPRSDNLDRMIYELAKTILEGEERVTWQGTEDDKQQVEIGNYRALLIHGDEVGRNGYASPMTILNHVAKWKSGAYPWPFRDCYMGHYHTHNEWMLPDGKGALFATGSPESDNRYALDTMASAAGPTQRLHFIDVEKGRVTAQYRVALDD